MDGLDGGRRLLLTHAADRGDTRSFGFAGPRKGHARAGSRRRRGLTQLWKGARCERPVHRSGMGRGTREQDQDQEGLRGSEQRAWTCTAADRGRWRGFSRSLRGDIEGWSRRALLTIRGARAVPATFCSLPSAGHVSSPRSLLGVTTTSAIANGAPCLFAPLPQLCTHALPFYPNQRIQSSSGPRPAHAAHTHARWSGASSPKKKQCSLLSSICEFHPVVATLTATLIVCRFLPAGTKAHQGPGC